MPVLLLHNETAALFSTLPTTPQRTLMTITEPFTADPTDLPITRGERARLVGVLQKAYLVSDHDPGDIADAILDERWRLAPSDPLEMLEVLDPRTRTYITLLAEHGPCRCDDTLPCEATGPSTDTDSCALCGDLEPDDHCPAHHPQQYPASPHPAVLLAALRAAHADFLAELRAALTTRTDSHADLRRDAR